MISDFIFIFFNFMSQMWTVTGLVVVCGARCPSLVLNMAAKLKKAPLV